MRGRFFPLPLRQVSPRIISRTRFVSDFSINKSGSASTAEVVLGLNQKLLDAVVQLDWKTYESLCSPSLTCFETESRGELVQGLQFHKFYYPPANTASAAIKQVTMASPHIRIIGDSCVILSYVRLIQTLGNPDTARVEETRIWEKVDGSWLHVHFHRSAHK